MDYEYVNGVLLPARPRPAHELEIATTADGRDITRGFIDSLPILPPLDPVLQSRGGDYRVYEELLRDDQVDSCFRQLRLAVVAAEWKVDAGGTKRIDKKAAESLDAQLKAIDFDRAFDKMLYGVFYGHGVAECIWQDSGSETTLSAIKVRKPRRFGFGPAGELKLKTSKNPSGEVMPPRKFWTFTYGGDNDDDPYGIGLAHALYWPVFFKRNGLKFWLTFLEKFGQPTTIGKYPNNSLPAEKNRLLRALSAIHTDGGIIVPEGMQIDLLEAARSGTADYAALCDRMDKSIAKICVGQTATTEGTPGKLGGDDAQSNVAEDLIKATSDLLCSSFNRGAAKWLTEWNYPGAALPRVWRRTEPDEDLTKRAERDEKVSKLGYRPTLETVQETYPGDWEPTQPAKPPLDPNAPPAAPGAVAFAEVKDSVAREDQLVALLEDEADAVVMEWVQQIGELVDQAKSLEEIRDRLIELLPGMKADKFAAVMQAALSIGHLAGVSDATDDALV